MDKHPNAAVAASLVPEEILARALGTTVNTLHAHPRDPYIAGRLDEVREIIELLGGLNSDPDAVLTHITNTPIRVLDNRTLLQAVADGDVDKARRYLRSISGGQAG